MSRPRCPKCRGNTFTIYERLEVAHAHAVVNGKVMPPEIADGLPSHLGYSALCRCGHAWVPKRATASAIIDHEAEGV